MIRVAWVLLAACAADDGPRLESVLPPAAGRNATVTVTGTRLCIPPDKTNLCGPVTIALGFDIPMVDAPVTAVSATTVQFSVPNAAPIGSTVIIATVSGRSSNAFDFEVTP